MKNKKLIQVIFDTYEFDLLKLRIETYSFIDLFIIFNNNNEIDSDKQTFLKKINPKIQFFEIKPCESQSDYFNECLEILNDLLKVVCVNFEDIIFFSQNNEFFDYDDLSEIKEEVKYNSFFVENHEFWWGKNLVSPHKFLGTYIFNFSEFLQEPKIVKNFWDIKFTNTQFRYKRFNGWTFNNFFRKPKGYEFFYNNLLALNSRNYKLNAVNNTIKIPNFFNFLPSCENPKSQKILITTQELKDYQQNGYDKICIIKFDENSSCSCDFEGEKIYKYILQIPKTVLYGNNDYQQFISEYKFNEIQKIKKLLQVTDSDVFEIKNPS